MKNLKVISAKYCARALTISSTICLLAFSGCSSIDGGAVAHGLATNLQMSPTEHDQGKPGNQPVDPDPGYNWFY